LGQIEVSCELRHKHFIQYEGIQASVVIRNRGGEPLVLGTASANAQLNFEIKNSKGYRISPVENAPLLSREIVVQPLSSVTNTVNLLQHYRMYDADTYTIKAAVYHDGFAFRSKNEYCDVGKGTILQTMMHRASGREITLRSTNRDRGSYLFLRFDSLDKKTCYGVFQLDRMLRSYKPELVIDSENQLHVLHMRSPRLFVHTVFWIEGRLVDQKVYEKGRRKVELTRDANGKIVVAGGIPVTR
jgi:hypothetical protein